MTYNVASLASGAYTRDEATAAFQQVLDWAEAAGGRDVEVPAGTYEVGPLTVGDGVRLALATGAQMNVTGDLLVGGDHAGVAGTGHGSFLNFVDGGLRLDATEATGAGRRIDYPYVRQVRVRRRGTPGPAVEVAGDGHGRHQFPNRWSISDLIVTGSSGDGLAMRGTILGTVVNPYLRHCLSGVGLLVDRDRFAGSQSANAVTVVGGEIQGNRVGVRLVNCAGASFQGTAIEGNQEGCDLPETSRGVTFDGCYFEHNYGYDLRMGTVSSGYSIKATNCLFYNEGAGKDHAVLVGSVRGFRAEGCTFVGYHAEPIKVTSAWARGHAAGLGNQILPEGDVALVDHGGHDRFDQPAA